jgi:hypothetical protein
MIVARIERLEAADIRDADTRSRRLARHAEAVRVPFQAKRTTASDETWLPLCMESSTA